MTSALEGEIGYPKSRQKEKCVASFCVDKGEEGQTIQKFRGHYLRKLHFSFSLWE